MFFLCLPKNSIRRNAPICTVTVLSGNKLYQVTNFSIFSNVYKSKTQQLSFNYIKIVKTQFRRNQLSLFLRNFETNRFR